MRHNISTTIVEVDPAVYRAARTFFGLPDPAEIFLEDAREWAANKRVKIEAGQNEVLFDIVVHDCFSGGGVPEHIYTLEFWNDLKASLQPDGLLVVVSDHSIHLSHDYVLTLMNRTLQA
jgi:spermidine synthase